MAAAARAVEDTAQRAEAAAWPWHVATVGSVRASVVRSAERRMEAAAYLTDGYGVRLAIESKPSGWVPFDALATASAPPRIKQILVGPEHGTPYLNTSQVFDFRPNPRKWLALGKTLRGTDRLVHEGCILVMASATVGRAIVATKAHENAIISHHFLRVTPRQPEYSGWVYAFLRSPQGLSMIKGSQYASVIRHIEPRHLATLPVPLVPRDLAAKFTKRVRAIAECRDRATALSEPWSPSAGRRLSRAERAVDLVAHGELGATGGSDETGVVGQAIQALLRRCRHPVHERR